MKKIVILLFTIMILFSFTACDDPKQELPKVISSESDLLEKDGRYILSGNNILGENIQVSKQIYIPVGTKASLDLNGKQLDSQFEGPAIYNDGTLNVYDDSTTASGIICNSLNENSSKKKHLIFDNYGSLTINGGTFGDCDTDKENENKVNWGAAIFNNPGAEANIKKGNFTCGDNYWNTDSFSTYSYAIINEGNMIIEDCYLYGKMNGGIASQENGNTVIKGGYFSVSGDKSYYVLVTGNPGKFEIHDGTFEKIGGNGHILGGFSGMPSWDASESLKENGYYITGGTYIKDGEQVVFQKNN